MNEILITVAILAVIFGGYKLLKFSINMFKIHKARRIMKETERVFRKDSIQYQNARNKYHEVMENYYDIK